MRKFFIALFLVLPLSAQTPGRLTPERSRAFEDFVERQMARDRTVGLSVAVLDGDQLWARGFGFADLENGVKATERSSYRMASVSKPMTAAAALRLAEQGVLDLDADIRRYVPHFPDKGKTITTRQLLSHLGGISHYRNYDVEGRIREPKTTKEAIEIFARFDLVNEPGAAYHYSSYGYNLIGAAVEGATGRSYADVMRELVWEPAGMTATRLDSPADLIPFRVSGYRLVNGEIKRSEYIDISSRFAGGGARSTVIDMVRFAQAVNEGKLLRRETVDAMWWPAQTTAGRYVNYGLGWNVMPVNGHYYVSHGGSQQEARTLLMSWPARKLTIAFASNFEDVDFSPYRIYLYWLLTGEVWGEPAYTPDRLDRLAVAIAERAIDAGGLYFEKYGRPMTTSPAGLRHAFAYINDAFRLAASDPAAAEKAIADGIHPGSGQPLVIAGSWIVSRSESHGGALAAVSRYLASGPRHSLSAPLARRIHDLARAWSSVWNEEAMRLIVDPPEGDRLVEAVAKYRGLRIAPNHAGKLAEEVEKNARRGNLDLAERTARLASDVYPDDRRTAHAQGIIKAAKAKGTPRDP